MGVRRAQAMPDSVPMAEPRPTDHCPKKRGAPGDRGGAAIRQDLLAPILAEMAGRFQRLPRVQPAATKRLRSEAMQWISR
jgi:hypothetical protein